MKKVKKYNIRGFFEVEQEDGSWVRIFDEDRPANIPTDLNIIFKESMVQIQIKQFENRQEVQSDGTLLGVNICPHCKGLTSFGEHG